MANLLDGKKIAAEIREEIKSAVAVLKTQNITPKLSVVLIGSDPASVVYAKAKEKACANVGMDYELHVLPETTPEDKTIALIEKLNTDNNVHGILIELPLPKALNKEKIMAAVSPLKDVDGVHPINRGYILSNSNGLFPATPQSCIEILLRHNIDLKGKEVVLVGRGDTIGKPLVFMLLNQDATVTVCHTKTTNLSAHTRQADIVIAAAGKAKMITADMLKPGAIVVDAGINQSEDGICGDVDFKAAEKVAGAISPVPGGVGSLTTVLIQRNVLKAIALQKRTNGGNK
ncbi:MAG: Bifunctional protein folD [Firmicutes bacterium]|nr:Bifunctional protein folD [Bacillota bacterium]